MKVLGDALDFCPKKPAKYVKRRTFCIYINNFLIEYYVLPSIPSYWFTLDDRRVRFVAKTMPKNEFQVFLYDIHVNDNTPTYT